MTKQRAISALLYLGVVFYVLGAAIHFFGLSVYPWFVAELHSSYHDTLIAISSLAMAIFFFQGARYPDNKPLLNAIITATLVCGPLIILMGIFVDFDALGAAMKSSQAVLEGIAAVVLGAVLLLLSRK